MTLLRIGNSKKLDGWIQVNINHWLLLLSADGFGAWNINFEALRKIYVVVL